MQYPLNISIVQKFFLYIWSNEMFFIQRKKYNFVEMLTDRFFG